MYDSLSTSERRYLLANMVRWWWDPVAFSVEVCGFEPDRWQAKTMAAFPWEDRIAVTACKGPGKTATEAILNLNFLTTRYKPKGACTSITGANLKDGLWSEVALWRSKSRLLSALLDQNGHRLFLREDPENSYISARTWAKSADREAQSLTLAGLHADHLIFTVDEAGGVPDGVVAAAEAGLANISEEEGREAHLFICGNPTHNEGPLFRACTSERDLWWLWHVTADPNDKDRTPRVSVKWATEQIRKYGIDSPYVAVNVFGRFPKTSTDRLISVAAMMDASARYEESMRGKKVIGADIARQGNDRTVLTFRSGMTIERCEEWEGHRLTFTAGEIHRHACEYGAEEVRIDDCGVGGGVTDILLANDSRSYEVLPINAGEAARDPERYANVRAEMSWQLRQVLMEDPCLGIHPSIVAHSTLQAEATTIKYGHDTKQRITIEPKKDFKARAGQSPDYLDSLCLAVYDVGPSVGATFTEDDDAYDLIASRGRFSPFGGGRPTR